MKERSWHALIAVALGGLSAYMRVMFVPLVVLRPKLPEGFNVLVKELQGLGLKVDLLDHGESADAGDVIEKTSKEIEKSKDDQSIYDQHKKDTEPVILDLDDDEAEAMMADEGIEITEIDEDDGTVDLGEEF